MADKPKYRGIAGGVIIGPHGTEVARVNVSDLSVSDSLWVMMALLNGLNNSPESQSIVVQRVHGREPMAIWA